ncbi:MAG: class I adenylate-forming enzyme family protein [Methanomicrobiales archaeon]
MLNCTTFLDAHARHAPAAPAIIDPRTGIHLTYADLLDRVSRLACGLSRAGIDRGGHVCIYLENSIPYLLAYLAIWRIGAVAVPANIVLREGELAYLTGHAGAQAIITSLSGLETARAVRPTLSDPEAIMVTDADDEPGTVSWNGLLAAPSGMRAAPCRCDDLCQIQYTSGTTGRPKGAMLTHGNWMAGMEAEREVLGLGPDDVYLGIYPMAHVGVSWGFSALRAGASWVLMERFDLQEYIDLAEQYRCTVLASMPPVIHSLLQAPEGTGDRLRRVREMISGGGPLHPAIWKPFHQRYRIPIVNAYGLSETVVVGTGTAIRPSHYATAEEFLSVGTPTGYSEVKIVDEQDPTRERGINETGEVALRGPGVALGYWQMPEETAAAFLPDGWFLTGDIGHIDGDGMLSITDRKKDMIVMSGWKIYPTEVEEILLRHPGVRDIAVFGCPHPRRGEIPVAAVVPADGAALDAADLIAFARAHMAPYKAPREVLVVEDLPRAHGWKILRRSLRERFCTDTDLTSRNQHPHPP